MSWRSSARPDDAVDPPVRSAGDVERENVRTLVTSSCVEFNNGVTRRCVWLVAQDGFEPSEGWLVRTGCHQPPGYECAVEMG